MNAEHLGFNHSLTSSSTATAAFDATNTGDAQWTLIFFACSLLVCITTNLNVLLRGCCCYCWLHNPFLLSHPTQFIYSSIAYSGVLLAIGTLCQGIALDYTSTSLMPWVGMLQTVTVRLLVLAIAVIEWTVRWEGATSLASLCWMGFLQSIALAVSLTLLGYQKIDNPNQRPMHAIGVAFVAVLVTIHYVAAAVHLHRVRAAERQAARQRRDQTLSQTDSSADRSGNGHASSNRLNAFSYLHSMTWLIFNMAFVYLALVLDFVALYNLSDPEFNAFNPWVGVYATHVTVLRNGALFVASVALLSLISNLKLWLFRCGTYTRISTWSLRGEFLRQVQDSADDEVELFISGDGGYDGSIVPLGQVTTDDLDLDLDRDDEALDDNNDAGATHAFAAKSDTSLFPPIQSTQRSFDASLNARRAATGRTTIAKSTSSTASSSSSSRAKDQDVAATASAGAAVAASGSGSSMMIHTTLAHGEQYSIPWPRYLKWHNTWAFRPCFERRLGMYLVSPADIYAYMLERKTEVFRRALRATNSAYEPESVYEQGMKTKAFDADSPLGNKLRDFVMAQSRHSSSVAEDNLVAELNRLTREQLDVLIKCVSHFRMVRSNGYLVHPTRLAPLSFLWECVNAFHFYQCIQPPPRHKPKVTAMYTFVGKSMQALLQTGLDVRSLPVIERKMASIRGKTGVGTRLPDAHTLQLSMALQRSSRQRAKHGGPVNDLPTFTEDERDAYPEADDAHIDDESDVGLVTRMFATRFVTPVASVQDEMQAEILEVISAKCEFGEHIQLPRVCPDTLLEKMEYIATLNKNRAYFGSGQLKAKFQSMYSTSLNVLVHLWSPSWPVNQVSTTASATAITPGNVLYLALLEKERHAASKNTTDVSPVGRVHATMSAAMAEAPTATVANTSSVVEEEELSEQPEAKAARLQQTQIETISRVLADPDSSGTGTVEQHHDDDVAAAAASAAASASLHPKKEGKRDSTLITSKGVSSQDERKALPDTVKILAKAHDYISSDDVSFLVDNEVLMDVVNRQTFLEALSTSHDVCNELFAALSRKAIFYQLLLQYGFQRTIPIHVLAGWLLDSHTDPQFPCYAIYRCANVSLESASLLAKMSTLDEPLGRLNQNDEIPGRLVTVPGSEGGSISNGGRKQEQQQHTGSTTRGYVRAYADRAALQSLLLVCAYAMQMNLKTSQTYMNMFIAQCKQLAIFKPHLEQLTALIQERHSKCKVFAGAPYMSYDFSRLVTFPQFTKIAARPLYHILDEFWTLHRRGLLCDVEPNVVTQVEAYAGVIGGMHFDKELEQKQQQKRHVLFAMWELVSAWVCQRLHLFPLMLVTGQDTNGTVDDLMQYYIREFNMRLRAQVNVTDSTHTTTTTTATTTTSPAATASPVLDAATAATATSTDPVVSAFSPSGALTPRLTLLETGSSSTLAPAPSSVADLTPAGIQALVSPKTHERQVMERKQVRLSSTVQLKQAAAQKAIVDYTSTALMLMMAYYTEMETGVAMAYSLPRWMCDDRKNAIASHGQAYRSEQMANLRQQSDAVTAKQQADELALVQTVKSNFVRLYGDTRVHCMDVWARP